MFAPKIYCVEHFSAGKLPNRNFWRRPREARNSLALLLLLQLIFELIIRAAEEAAAVLLRRILDTVHGNGSLQRRFFQTTFWSLINVCSIKFVNTFEILCRENNVQLRRWNAVVCIITVLVYIKYWSLYKTNGKTCQGYQISGVWYNSILFNIHAFEHACILLYTYT